MANSAITVELPETLRAFVETEAQALEYGTPGEFLRSLAEEALSRRAALEAHIQENLKSDSIRVPQDVLERGELVDFLEQQLNESL
jgi:Arc/MetJ-type ribon-helix-helix transcriptional regulator